jgi:hypothetical protein
MARKVVYCPYCAATNGTVKKAAALRIIHDKFRAKKTAEEMTRWKETFSSAIEVQKDLATHLNKAVAEDLNPLKTLDLFKRISDEVIYHSIFLSVFSKTHLRIANCSVSAHYMDDLNSFFGNTSQFLLFAYDRQLLRMAHQMKMT